MPDWYETSEGHDASKLPFGGEFGFFWRENARKCSLVGLEREPVLFVRVSSPTLTKPLLSSQINMLPLLSSTATPKQKEPHHCRTLRTSTHAGLTRDREGSLLVIVRVLWLGALFHFGSNISAVFIGRTQGGHKQVATWPLPLH